MTIQMSLRPNNFQKVPFVYHFIKEIENLEESKMSDRDRIENELKTNWKQIENKLKTNWKRIEVQKEKGNKSPSRKGK